MEEMYALIVQVLDNQLQHFWKGLYDLKVISNKVENAYNCLMTCCEKSCSKYEQMLNDIYCNSNFWSIFLYFLSHEMYKEGNIKEADCIYYLNKVMNSVDWFYAVDLPEHFMVEHPIGSVLGKAQYGDFLYIYQGVTIGGNYDKDGCLFYPVLGNHIIMYGNSTLVGKCDIGDYVIIANGTYILNEIIPDNCIVFGRSPDIKIKEFDNNVMRKRFEKYWKY